MPVASKDYTLLANHVRETWTIPVEYHIIKAINIFKLAGYLGMENIYGELGLMQGGVALSNKIVALSWGYFGDMSPLGWSGSIMTEPDTFIYAQALGPNAVQLRLTSVLYKVVGSKEGLILVDP